MAKITRRDFLKLAGNLSAGAAIAGLLPGTSGRHGSDTQPSSIIILVFDALSAKHLSLYGYPRRTSPNFESFAERALVYHRHYSNGNFTTPGTASLLSGMQPWTHRAVNASGFIRQDLAARNLFRLLEGTYYRLAYTQNLWADYLLNQLSVDIDSHVPLAMFSLIPDVIMDKQFRNDPLNAYRAYETMLFPGIFQNPNSLLFGFFLNLFYQYRVKNLTPDNYPLGLPTSNNLHHVYTLESTIDGVIAEISRLAMLGSPYLAYFHLWPPHSPYRPRQEFVGLFKNDGFVPPAKQMHALSTDSSEASLNGFRREYDEYLANVDAEFGRLVQALEEQGVFDRSYVFVTTDHGEMFERGTYGHFTPLLYEPVIRIPLLVSVPGQRLRRDIHSLTSNIDIVPTLLKIAGRPIPAWCEGDLLPEMGGAEDSSRSIISMDAKENPAFGPFSTATYTIIKDSYKLIYYNGYKGRYKDFFEFYDLGDDPEEMRNRMSKEKYKDIIAEMQNELLGAIEAAGKLSQDP